MINFIFRFFIYLKIFLNNQLSLFNVDDVKVNDNLYRLKNVKFLVNKKSNNIINLGRNSKLEKTKFIIKGKNNKIHIGENVRIQSTIFSIEDNNCIIHIGNNTTCEGAEFLISENNSCIYLGSDCMLSNDIEFRTGDSHTIIDLDSYSRVNWAKDIKIGDHVWIGAHSRILKGTVIPDNCIIGLGSVVTGKLKANNNSLYAGSPVKLIKSNITWDRKRWQKSN